MPILAFLTTLMTVLGSRGYAATVSETDEILQIKPPVMERTLFGKSFHTITITGSCPEKSEVILRVVSPTRDFKMNKAGKRLGFIWMSVGHAELKDIPVMYVILSSARISSVLPPAEQEKAGLDQDFKEVYEKANIRFEHGPPRYEIANLRYEYVSGLIKIFRGEGLYQIQEGSIKVNGGRFEARFVRPPGAPLGQYTVLCYTVQDGKARLMAQGGFLVQSSRIVNWLSYHATASPAIYGVLAALIAVIAGLFVGAVFRRRAGH